MNQREELFSILTGTKYKPSVMTDEYASEVKEMIDRIMSLFAPRPIDDEAKRGEKIIGFFTTNTYCCPCSYVNGKWFAWFDDDPSLELEEDPVFYTPFPEKLEGYS